MHMPWRSLLCFFCAASGAPSIWAQESTAQESTAQEPAAQAPTDTATGLIWSAGLRLKMDDFRRSGQVTPRPIIGLRYGRWRAGPVDGDSWHRFGQVKTDNTLTYDWLDTARLRTSLSASIVNLQKDSTLDALESGRKTVRGKATIDYLAWSHWSIGLVATQDLLNRGAGTALSPNMTYRQALSDDSTLLLSQSFTWATATMWTTDHQLSPESTLHRGQGWGSMDTSLTLRQRWKPHLSWYMQMSRSHVLGPIYPVSLPERTTWSAQAGVIYFGR